MEMKISGYVNRIIFGRISQPVMLFRKTFVYQDTYICDLGKWVKHKGSCVVQNRVEGIINFQSLLVPFEREKKNRESCDVKWDCSIELCIIPKNLKTPRRPNSNDPY